MCLQVKFTIIRWTSLVLGFTEEYKYIGSKIVPVLQHLLAFIENFHIMTPYRAVINNKEELEVFWFVDNRYTLEDKKNEVD